MAAALTRNGFQVTEVIRSDTFARLLLSDDAAAEPEKLELAADWRANPPVLLKVGPVLHPDDAVANKMAALYGRAAARDFLDVDSAVESGRYTRGRLFELAQSADPGFEPLRFADALNVLTEITDADFGMYNLPPRHLPALRERFAHWRASLMGEAES